MSCRRFLIASVIALTALATTLPHAQTLALTPPMGWNSWDAYGLTIDEADYKANATVLAGLKQYGWQYAVIDEGWYMENPFGAHLEQRKYLWNANGILIPVASRFPSSADGAGFKPLADWVHAQGLKFGIHIVRGIPRQVVKENLPIAGSSFHAADAADTDGDLPVGRRQLRREGQCGRAGLLRLDAEALCGLGPGLTSRWTASATTLTGPRRSARLPRRSRKRGGRLC